MMDNNYTVASLFDGGWRAEDREELKTEYGFSEDELDSICSDLADMATVHNA